MKSCFGKNITLTLFGESHGPVVGVVADGLAPGIPVDPEAMRRLLKLRRCETGISTARREPDEVQILSGLYNGHTTGTPLCLMIQNGDVDSLPYEDAAVLPRPSHADYTAGVKYRGWQDPRGGGHFSGRLTAPLTALGSIFLGILSSHGIRVCTRIARCGGIADSPLPRDERVLEKEMERMSRSLFPVIDEDAGSAMRERILEAKDSGDSVGGVLETIVLGLPAGIGEPWFWSAESEISHLLFSIPAVKGVEFGTGFSIADLHGSSANDAFILRGTRVCTSSNHSGGIQGGITNGMPLVVRTAIKPTPSIAKPQQTVDLRTRSKATLTAVGRYDPAIVHRVRTAASTAVAFGLTDLAVDQFGAGWLTSGFIEIQPDPGETKT